MTLIELLVVISIIGVLAGLILPAVGNVKKKARVVQAQKDMADMKGAISVYQHDYSRLPASGAPVAPDVVQGAGIAGTDFTFGTAGTGYGTNVYNNGNPPGSYQESNRELMVILTASGFTGYATPHSSVQTDRRNPRKTGYFNAKSSGGSGITAGKGLGDDGVMRDPWGNPYIIALDLNYDGWVSNSVYNHDTVNNGVTPSTGLVRQGAAGTHTWALKDSVMIMSFGADGQFGPSSGAPVVAAAAANADPNKDNVLSWK